MNDGLIKHEKSRMISSYPAFRCYVRYFVLRGLTLNDAGGGWGVGRPRSDGRSNPICLALVTARWAIAFEYRRHGAQGTPTGASRT